MRQGRAAGLGSLVIALLMAAIAHGQPRPQAMLRRDTPCPGCVLRMPAAATGRPLPLVVALHGDNGSPTRLVELLQAEADRRGFAVLALACPQALGCDRRSFWQWRGAPRWLAAQVDALPATWVNPQQIYLLGWSGGASYLSDVMVELPPRFAAVALLGGGMPSQQAGACARCKVPIYFAVGERNPLAYLARSARDALRACGHPLRYESLPRADHDGEWSALQRGKIAEVLAFFADHSLACRD